MNNLEPQTKTSPFQEVLDQFDSGCISFIEFIRYCHSLVTEKMVTEHNAYIDRNLDMFTENDKAEWPFKG